MLRLAQILSIRMLRVLYAVLIHQRVDEGTRGNDHRAHLTRATLGDDKRVAESNAFATTRNSEQRLMREPFVQPFDHFVNGLLLISRRFVVRFELERDLFHADSVTSHANFVARRDEWVPSRADVNLQRGEMVRRVAIP